jgi:hypothetical protein
VWALWAVLQIASARLLLNKQPSMIGTFLVHVRICKRTFPTSPVMAKTPIASYQVHSMDCNNVKHRIDVGFDGNEAIKNNIFVIRREITNKRENVNIFLLLNAPMSDQKIDKFVEYTTLVLISQPLPASTIKFLLKKYVV